MALFTVLTAAALAKRNARPAPEPRTLTKDQVLDRIFGECLQVVGFMAFGFLIFAVLAFVGELGMRIFAILFDIGCLIGIAVRIRIYRRERDEYLRHSNNQ